MQRPSLPELLNAWRAAERRWERPASDADVRTAASGVLAAWLAYQDAALPPEPGEFILVAGDDQVYVAATAGVRAVLGYEPDELVGRTISELASPELRGSTADEWAAFLAAGRLDGRFRLMTKSGSPIALRFQARVHHPVPGFHISRLWPDDGG
jgi:PAS domain-containing protein